MPRGGIALVGPIAAGRGVPCRNSSETGAISLNRPCQTARSGFGARCGKLVRWTTVPGRAISRL
jgi:hypothetical protein